MRPTLLALPALALLLAACSGGGEPSKPAHGAAATTQPAGSERLAQPPSGAPAAAHVSSEKAPAPKLIAASGTRPAMLDTGIDLSHIKEAPAAEAPAFPTALDPAAHAGPPAPAGPPGALALLDGDIDTSFGELLEGSKVSKRFRLKSSGENPLVIERVKPSCGCTATEVEIVAADGTKSVYELGQPIPAGGEFELEVSVNTANRRGPFQSSVAIYSNDPKSPLNLRLQADVKAVLDVEPMNLDFGTVTSGDMKEGTFKISTTVLEPFLLTLDETRVIEPLKATLKAVDPDAEGRSRTWELAVALGPGTPEGMRQYPLRLVTDIPQAADDHAHAEQDAALPAPPPPMRELNCRVAANVTGLVVATPNFISLGVVRPGEVVERSVKIETLDPDFALPAAPACRLVSLTGGEFAYADAFTVLIAPTPGAEGKSLDVTLRLEGMPEDASVSFGGMVQIDIGHPTKPELSVRFSGLARPGIPPGSENNAVNPAVKDG